MDGKFPSLAVKEFPRTWKEIFRGIFLPVFLFPKMRYRRFYRTPIIERQGERHLLNMIWSKPYYGCWFLFFFFLLIPNIHVHIKNIYIFIFNKRTSRRFQIRRTRRSRKSQRNLRSRRRRGSRTSRGKRAVNCRLNCNLGRNRRSRKHNNDEEALINTQWTKNFRPKLHAILKKNKNTMPRAKSQEINKKKLHSHQKWMIGLIYYSIIHSPFTIKISDQIRYIIFRSLLLFINISYTFHHACFRSIKYA